MIPRRPRALVISSPAGEGKTAWLSARRIGGGLRWGKTKTEVAENGIAAPRDCRAPIAGAVR